MLIRRDSFGDCLDEIKQALWEMHHYEFRDMSEKELGSFVLQHYERVIRSVRP